MSNIIMFTPPTGGNEDSRLNGYHEIATAWRDQFDDVCPPLSLDFTVNSEDELMLNGIVIDSMSRISPLEAEVYLEHIYLSSTVRPEWYYKIHVIWAYSGEMYIDEISLVLHKHAA